MHFSLHSYLRQHYKQVQLVVSTANNLLTLGTVSYIIKVIKSEFCVPCGRRTKFGKMYLRCQDCRVVTHPECRDHCPMPCNPTAVSTPIKNTEVYFSDCLLDIPPPILSLFPLTSMLT